MPSTTSIDSSLQLRDYQKEANAEIRRFEALYPTGSVVVQGPTGSGKTACIADLLTDPFPQLVLTDRKVLFAQLHRCLNDWGIAHGCRAAGYATTYNVPIQLAMVQTENVRGLPPIPGCRRIIIDEKHKNKGRMIQSLIKKYGANASKVGLTATPSELGADCDELIVMATVRGLTERGYLTPHVMYGPLVPDLELLARARRQVNGDYAASDVEKFYPIKAIFGRMVDTWREHNPKQLPTIGFAVGVPQSLFAAQHCTSYGIPSVHVDCKNIWMDGCFLPTDDDNLDLVRYKMERGDIKIVFNRYILREGLDWPFLKCALLCTPFGSRQTFVQAVGRILRISDNADEAIVIDNAGNWLLHPPIDSDLPWDWRTPQRILAAERIDDMREYKIPEPIRCSKCSAIRVEGNTCPKCGFTSHQQSRWVLQVNGKLKLVHGKCFRPRRTEQTQKLQRIYIGKLMGNRKYSPKRTVSQIVANMARENGWVWPDTKMKGMPKTSRGFHIPVGQLTAGDLIHGEEVLK